MKATTSIFINKHSPNSKGECSISIRVTYDRKRKYYPTGINLTEADFKKVMGERPKEQYKKIAFELSAFEQKAYSIIKENPVFTWEKFEKQFFSNRASREFITAAYQEIIDELEKEDRWGTASSYECSINSLSNFKKDLRFQDVTVGFLRSYEKQMLDEGKSSSTVGIYLRPLRAVFNTAISNGYLSRDLYPFGKRRYEIPTSRNIKKALPIQKIGEIFRYQPASEKEEKYRAYWVFLYLCNGINVKDMCLLKYNNIKERTIEYLRAKTIKTKRIVEPIEVTLKDEMKVIIEKWGNKKFDGNTYVFPEISDALSKKQQRLKIQQLTKNINTNMTIIARSLGLEHNLTSYWARHSFASVLKLSGKSDEFICEAFGHSDLKTTRNYLASFEQEQKADAAKALTAF